MNNRLPTKADADTLENMIDRTSLYEVLSIIEGICAAKADHLRSNWQDDYAAKLWDRAGADICEVSSSDPVEMVSV